MDRIKLQVLGLSYNHSNSGAYALVLAEEEGERRIPIIIGGVEAQAIAIQLEGLTPPRPLTHDLFVSFAEAYNINIEEVFIYKLKEGIFYSELVCNDGKNRIRIDSRTSDAVALALRFHVPIYTSGDIIDKAGSILEAEKNTVTQDKTNQPEPKKEGKKSELSSLTVEELNEQLASAIENEDYEVAALINQEINRRKK